METRKQTNVPRKDSGLPADYLEMIEEVFQANFSEGLEALSRLGATSRFEAHGAVLPDEILLAVTLLIEGRIAATTFKASVDFDPKASAPTAQDLLAACVDALGVLVGQVLGNGSAEHLAPVLAGRLADHENVPFEWTPTIIEGSRIHLKMDASNPTLDQAADDFLSKNDPDFQARQFEEELETKELFVTGTRKEGGGETTH